MNLEVVKDYYGKVLKTSEDLKSSACCDESNMPAHLETLLANVHEVVRAKYYGCGIVVPAALEGARVLDLGSGSGRDVYLIAQLVGSEGEVVGVDMTDEQLAVAESHIDWHMRAFGYPQRNVRFLKGSLSTTRRCRRSSVRLGSSRRPTGCSSSMTWKRPAKITARR
jgi:arsenite methyltransferase